MNPIDIELAPDLIERLSSGQSSLSDLERLRSRVVVSGATTHDVYNVRVQDVTDVQFHVGPQIVQGADPAAVEAALKEALEAIARDRYDSALRDYFRALRSFTESSYRALPFPQGMSLSEVYVPLRVRSGVSWVQSQVSRAVDLQEVLRTASSGHAAARVLIIGEPGSGKSTLIRQIARSAWDRPAEIGLDKPHLALPIRLQSVATADHASAEERIWRAIDNAKDLFLVSSPPPGFFTTWPNRLQARWLILLDGFDEVSPSRRTDVLGWIESLARLGYPIVITTRPTTYLDEFEDLFGIYFLEPFTRDQQTLLAHRWLGERASAFIAELEDAQLGAFAETPLLLTIAAIVYRKDGQLPLNRVPLYRRFIQVWWKEALERGMAFELSGDLADVAQDALRNVALAMTKRFGQSEALPVHADLAWLTEELAAFLSGFLGRPLPLTRQWAERLLEILGRRSGVFQATASDGEWLHPTFREYMAAEAITAELASNSPQAQEWMGRWSLDHWRQVMLFALGIWSEKGSTTDLIRTVLESRSALALVFAADAVAEGAAISRDLQHDILTRLCQEALKNADTNYCARLLTFSQGEEEVLQRLVRLRDSAMGAPYVRDLAVALSDLARQPGQERGSAIPDLAKLHAGEELLGLARDEALQLEVRGRAARELVGLVESVIAVSVLADLLRHPGLNFDNARNLIEALGSLRQGGQVLGEIAHNRTCPLKIRAAIPAVLAQAGLLQECIDLSQDEETDLPIRVLAQVHGALVGRLELQMDLLIRFFADPDLSSEILEQTLASLVKLESWKELATVATHPLVPRRTRKEALTNLVWADQQEVLAGILTEASLSIRIRLLVAGAAESMELRPVLIEAHLSFYGELLTRNRSWRISFRRASLLYKLNRHQEAVLDLDRVLAQVATHRWALLARGHCHAILGNLEAAIEDLDLFLERYPVALSTNFALCLRGGCLAILGYPEQSVADFERAQALGSLESWSLRYFGDSLRQVYRVADALAVLTEAVTALPEGMVERISRASAYGALGQWEQALADLDIALQVDGNNQEARRLRAKYLRCAGFFESAVTEVSSLLEEDPDDSELISMRAELLLRLGGYPQAEIDLQRLGAEERNKGWSLYIAGLLAQARGDTVEFRLSLALAQRKTLEVLQGDPDNLSLRTNAALIELASGRLAEAESIFRTLLQDRAGEIHLREYGLPKLGDLLAVLPDQPGIRHLHRILQAALAPQPVAAEFSDATPTPSLQDLPSPKDLHRGSYPFPMYCRLAYIGGLEEDKDLAEKLLEGRYNPERLILLWTIDSQNDRLYGHCNFRWNEDDDRHFFKFCDSFETIAYRDLQIFAKHPNVPQLLFLENALLSRFQSVVRELSLPFSCALFTPAEKEDWLASLEGGEEI